MHQNYRIEERVIKDIIRNNSKPIDLDQHLNIIFYYKKPRCSNLIMKNNLAIKSTPLQKTNVIYSFSCPSPHCKADQYIGLTQTTLSRRLTMHAQAGSILQHFKTKHKTKPTRQQLVDNTKILAKAESRYKLAIKEALLILKKNPQINKQFDNFTNILKLHTHRNHNPNILRSSKPSQPNNQEIVHIQVSSETSETSENDSVAECTTPDNPTQSHQEPPPIPLKPIQTIQSDRMLLQDDVATNPSPPVSTRAETTTPPFTSVYEPHTSLLKDYFLPVPTLANFSLCTTAPSLSQEQTGIAPFACTISNITSPSTHTTQINVDPHIPSTPTPTLIRDTSSNSLSPVPHIPHTSASLITQCHNIVASNAPPNSYTTLSSISINQIECNPHVPFASNMLSFTSKSQPSSQCEFDFSFPSVNFYNDIKLDNPSHINSFDNIKQLDIHHVHPKNDDSYILDTTQLTRPDYSMEPVISVATISPLISDRVCRMNRPASAEQREYSATNTPDKRELLTYPCTSSIYRSDQQRKQLRQTTE